MRYSQKLAHELEAFLVSKEERVKAPQDAIDLFESESSQGVPTSIALHPDLGYFVIQSSGQGPYIIWPE